MLGQNHLQTDCLENKNVIPVSHIMLGDVDKARIYGIFHFSPHLAFLIHISTNPILAKKSQNSNAKFHSADIGVKALLYYRYSRTLIVT